MKVIAAVILGLVGASAHAQSFRIEERTDALTRETYLQAKGMKLCQIKSAGFAAQCATLEMAWQPSHPELVALRIEMPTLTSVLEVAVNVDGQVRRYGAEVPVTDINYDSGLRMAAGLGFSSANLFVLPVEVLRSLASDPDAAILRVSGTHTSIDFDFRRKAKMKGLPADELRKFLESVEEEKAASGGPKANAE